jgi:hypothetical protein
MALLARRSLPRAGSSPADVAAWWSTLSAGERARLVAEFPDHLGSLDGVPAAARHAGNTAVLQRELHLAQLAVANAGPTWVAGYSFNSAPGRRLALLESVHSQLVSDPARRLLVLDPRGSGLAAIALGDVDTAHHVAVVVPGLDKDVRQDNDNIVWNASRLHRTAGELTNQVAQGEQVAAVAWLGYRTPTIWNVWSEGSARRGAPQLDGFVRGVDTSREAARVFDGNRPGAHLTVVAHSYGSLTAGLVARNPTPIDELVFIGSPGVGAKTAGSLAMPAGHVYAGVGDGDKVRLAPRFGRHPGREAFGARVFQTDGGLDPLTCEPLLGSNGHSEHFTLRSESVRNISLIVLDRADAVTYVRRAG